MSQISNIMSVESLLAYGFHEYKPNQFDKHDRSFQFCKRTEKGKKFYVDVRFWNFKKYRDNHPITDGWDAEVQFDMHGPKTFKMTFSCHDMTPSQVVEWVDSTFEKMNCTYYELYVDNEYDEEGNQLTYHCEKCRKYLPEGGTLCFSCSYTEETGFVPVVSKVRRVKRR